MIGPSLPNPFEPLPTGGDHSNGRRTRGSVLPETALDAAIVQALRSEPLASPPPLLYAAVMRSVRREPRPRFRLHWLDLALSLFAAGMPLLVWWAWRSLPPLWLNYLRLQVLYQLNKLWYFNFPLLATGAIMTGLMLAIIAVAILMQPRRLNIG